MAGNFHLLLKPGRGLEVLLILSKTNFYAYKTSKYSSDRALNFIDGIFKKHGLNIAKAASVGLVNHCRSFTSLRLAVILINTIAAFNKNTLAIEILPKNQASDKPEDLVERYLKSYGRAKGTNTIKPNYSGQANITKAKKLW